MEFDSDLSQSDSAFTGYDWPTGDKDVDMDNAKSYLLQTSSKSGMNMWVLFSLYFSCDLGLLVLNIDKVH